MGEFFMVTKIVRKYFTLLRIIEAKRLSPEALKLFKELNFDESWETNFATGGGSFAELDLLILHMLIFKQQPKTILELGSGKSTIAITKWLQKLNGDRSLISMDEYEKWGNLTIDNLKDLEFEHNSEVWISERVDGSIGMFRGTKYKKVPHHDYDFIFVDGPDPKGAVNIDALEILSQQEKPCNVLIDGRYRTVLAIQSMFPNCKPRKFVNNMTLFIGLCKTEFKSENNYAHIHFGRQDGFASIVKTINSLQ